MKVGFVGLGNMGQLLVDALVRSGALPPGDIIVSNRSPGKLERCVERHPGIEAVHQNADVPRRCQVIFLCVKAGETRSALSDMLPYISDDHLLVIITNAVEIEKIERATPARVAKVIPSVAQAVGAGASLLIFGHRCSPGDKVLLNRLFSTISHPFVITESQARVASDLTSCGPAFISYTLAALARAARQYQPDLSQESIDAMIRLTLGATSQLLDQLGYSFEDVIHRVSTPGGITAEGLNVMDEHMAGLWEQVIETTLTREETKKAKFEL